MGRHALLIAAAAAILVAGCATPDAQTQSQSPPAAAQKDDKYYHVGSHLPSKDPGRSVNESLGAKTDVYNDAMRRPPPPNAGQ